MPLRGDYLLVVDVISKHTYLTGLHGEGSAISKCDASYLQFAIETFETLRASYGPADVLRINTHLDQLVNC
jgi:hypothetical protein